MFVIVLYLCSFLVFFGSNSSRYFQFLKKQASTGEVVNSIISNVHVKYKTSRKLDGCIVWNAHNTVLGEEALLIHIVPVGYAT